MPSMPVALQDCVCREKKRFSWLSLPVLLCTSRCTHTHTGKHTHTQCNLISDLLLCLLMNYSDPREREQPRTQTECTVGAQSGPFRWKTPLSSQHGGSGGGGLEVGAGEDVGDREHPEFKTPLLRHFKGLVKMYRLSTTKYVVRRQNNDVGSYTSLYLIIKPLDVLACQSVFCASRWDVESHDKTLVQESHHKADC